MDFFNKIGQQVASGASAVANKTKDLTGSAKVNLQISQDESKITAYYTEIGKAFYESHKNNPPEAQAAVFANITALKEKISQAKTHLQQIKGTKACTNCGAQIDANTAFCASCGAKAPVVQAEPVAINCPSCGKSESPNVTFCSGCGCKLK